ncbi:MAG TPA: flagellar biosynthesis anti-sigma factor FlgM [Acidobacteriaceae bacterium]
MDVHDRSTYPSNLASPNLTSTGVDAPPGVRTDGRATASVRSTSGTDSTDLSPAAQVVAQAMQMPEIRQDRIASLQQQIASGTYQVASQDVADAMLRNLRG